MFERNLADVIRGIRANKGKEDKFIMLALEEIRKELKSNDLDLKAQAIAKLTYLQMMGYEMNWASFNVIEVMSSQKFAHKRIGYVAACQSFTPETEVLMLATNLIKKDLASANMYETGLALNGLANFLTPDLARDLSADVVSLLNNSRPYVRKKAVLCLYKIFLKFPDALRPAFPRLKEKLEDPDPSVTSAAVSVICELARKNPKNYLPLAPQLFKLLTDSSNNWMLIKIVKLFAALTPLEPRLSKKLVDPLTNLINTTPAMSLLYECINTVTQGMLDQPNLVKLSVTKLRIFIEDQDQNLKYLGLLALSRVLKDYPKLVAEHNDIILRCIEDADLSIRMRALDLLSGMVNKKNLPDVVKKLLSQISEGSLSSGDLFFRDDMVARIINICSQGGYQFVTDFEWYIGVLVELCNYEGTQQGKAIANQLLDVAIRVRVVREFALTKMVEVMNNKAILAKANDPQTSEVLNSAAWITGEFSGLVEDPARAIEAYLHPSVKLLPGHVQAVYVHNVLKVFANVKNQDELRPLGQLLIEKLPMFTQSTHLEVQERACTVLEIMKIIEEHDFAPEIVEEVLGLFEGELNPVAPKAQKKVPAPEDLDLETWINDPLSDDESEKNDFSFISGGGSHDNLGYSHDAPSSEDEETKEARRLERQEKRRHDPFYLGDSKRKPTSPDDIDIDSIPIATLTAEDLKLSSKSDRDARRKEKDRKRRKEVNRDDINIGEGEMPEGAVESDDEKTPRQQSYDALDVDLTAPLGKDESLPSIKAYDSPMEARQRAERMLQEENLRRAKEEEERRKRHQERKERKEGDDKDKDRERHRDKDKDRDRHSSSRHSSSRHHSEKSSRSSRSEKPSSSTSTSGTKKEDTPKKPQEVNLLDLLGDEIAPTPEKSGSSAAAAAAAAAATTSPPEKQSSGSRSSGSRSSDGHRSERSSRHRDDRDRERSGRERDRSSRDGERSRDKDRRREERKEEGGISSLQADLEGLGDITGMSAIPHGYTVLGSDEHLRFLGKTQISTSHENELSVNLIIQNLSSEPVASIELNILDSMNLKCKTSKNGVVVIPSPIAPGQSHDLSLRFSVQDIMVAQTVKTTATFVPQGSGGAKLDFKFNFPCSTFMVAAPCSKSQFTALLSDPTNFSAKESKTLNVGSRGFDAVMNLVASGLHLTVVEKLSVAASFYGTSTQNHLVAILVKQTDSPGVYTADLKCSDARLASSLIKELASLF